MNKSGEDDVPKWDVALEALAREEAEKLGRPLAMQDFKRLGLEYKIRFDDLMATLHQLVMNEAWDQTGVDAKGKPVSAAILQDLFVYNRLDEQVADKYAVTWKPVEHTGA